eukprot:tig00000350_g24330.t1
MLAALSQPRGSVLAVRRLATSTASVSASSAAARAIGGFPAYARLETPVSHAATAAAAWLPCRAIPSRGLSKKKGDKDKEEASGPPMEPFKVDEYRKKMDVSLEVLKKELASLQTGRALPALLDSITVPTGNTRTPLNKLGQITARDPQNLAVSLFDNTLIPMAAKAISEAGLSLNPLIEGAVIRVPVPKPSKEAREGLAKVVGKHQEHVKQSILKVRKDGMDYIKALEKKKAASENDLKRHEKDLQKVVDDHTKKVNDLCAAKVKEIMAS